MSVARVILVFQATLFDLTMNEEDVPGRDALEYVLDKLRKIGVQVCGEPVEGDGGWTSAVSIGGAEYLLFCHWAPIGHPPQDCWVIQPDIRKSIVRALFGTRTRDSEVQPVIEMLRQATAGDDSLSNVRWLTRAEFAAVY